MLHHLRRIVQEVNSAQDLPQALDIIVGQVKRAMGADVCSVYLQDREHRFALMATDGLNPKAVGKVRLEPGEGLIGVVAARAEPLNIRDAPAHPAYRFVLETGETRYHGFLGVPILQHGEVLGVVVVRHKDKHRFTDSEEAFLITLAAQLAGAITHAEATGEILDLLSDDQAPGLPQAGIPGSPGIHMGTAVVAYSPADLASVPDREVEDVAAEEEVFRAAVEAVQQEIRTFSQHMSDLLPAEDRALFDAYAMILGSDSLVQQSIERIRAGNWAPGALRASIAQLAGRFDGMENDYLRERAADLWDLGRRLLHRLRSDQVLVRDYPARTVLVGDQISAAQLAEVPLERLAGIVSVSGSGSSHVAILARALSVPAVMGVADLPVSRLEGSEIVVDGYRGHVYLRPSPAVREEFLRLEQEEQELTDTLADLVDKPCVTPDGRRIPLFVNSGLLADIGPSLRGGAEGVGLYRTEVPFMMRERFPGEEEQLAVYRQVLEAFAPRPVVLRTLDVGGDKPLPYFPIQEDNPFLGWRGIRISLDHPEIFLSQLRAALRASEGLNNLRLLLPMVSSVDEVDEALLLIQRAHAELVEEGVSVPLPSVGVMIEVPSAVYVADALARRVDFLSIGTNDLTQYLLAVDRNNPRVAGLYDGLHPAVLQALVQATEAGHRHDRPVSVCGEMAGDPVAAVLLVGMGVDCLSTNVSSLQRVKWALRTLTLAQARSLLDEALLLEEPHAVRRLVETAFEKAGLGGLVRAGQ